MVGPIEPLAGAVGPSLARWVRSVRVWFCGDDSEDRRFAESIAAASRAYTDTFLMDVDELERADDRGDPREEGFEGTPVFVVSRAMVAQDYHRRKLIGSARGLGRPATWRSTSAAGSPSTRSNGSTPTSRNSSIG